jgi:hypothetical protein
LIQSEDVDKVDRMLRSNTYQFYHFCSQVQPLKSLHQPGQKVKVFEMILDLWHGIEALNKLLNDEIIPVPLRMSGVAAKKAVEAIQVIAGPEFPKRFPENSDGEIDEYSLYSLKEKINELEIVLSHELPQVDTYCLSRKAIYDTSELVEHADKIIPAQLMERISDEAIYELRQAGRCLAFECPTAAAFHLLRATETVLRTYFVALVKEEPKKRDWGYYIDTLKKSSAPEKVTGVLDQIRQVHRNPTIHPEDVLSMDEAIVLFGICQSAIVAMASDLQSILRLKTPVEVIEAQG